MANPRYPQQQERQSPQDKKLAMLAGLVGLTGQMQQPALAQQAQSDHENQARIAAALQLLGLNQQQQNEQHMQQFRQNELTQRGDIAAADRAAQQQHFANLEGQYWGGDLPMKYAGLANESQDRQAALNEHAGEFWGGTLPAEYNKQSQDATAQQQALGVSMFGHALNVPGGNITSAMDAARMFVPQMGAMADQNRANEAQQNITKVAPGLRAIQDPKARELFGHSQLDKYGPDAYQKALALAFPETAGGPVPGTPAVGGVQLPSPDAQFNPKVDAYKLRDLMQQLDPGVAKQYDALGSITPPWGKGTSAEGSPMYQRGDAKYQDAVKQRAQMLVPYLFKMYGQTPINLNQS